MHLPDGKHCPDCGGTLRHLDEDVSEMLEYIPACFFVVRHVRPKFSCSRCCSVVQAAAPSRPVDRGLPGPSMLAHVITSKLFLCIDRPDLCPRRSGVGSIRSGALGRRSQQARGPVS